VAGQEPATTAGNALQGVQRRLLQTAMATSHTASGRPAGGTPAQGEAGRVERSGRPAHPEEQLASLARTLAHPLRVRVLSAAIRGGDVSPRRLADELGEPLGNLSYHVRALAKAGLIELKSTAQRRGAVEHFYAVTDRGRGLWRAAAALRTLEPSA
jgi:DNA-binding transcriptional ArsR family regulator